MVDGYRLGVAVSEGTKFYMNVRPRELSLRVMTVFSWERVIMAEFFVFYFLQEHHAGAGG